MGQSALTSLFLQPSLFCFVRSRSRPARSAGPRLQPAPSRGRQTGATSLTARRTARLVPRIGPTTPVEADLATTNLKLIARRPQTLRHAVQALLTHT